MHAFAWDWQGWPIQAAYEIIGHGPAVLLLPAFSTVSTREEMRPLASALVAAGFSCTLVDWPGFGASTRGRLDYGPALYRRFLADFRRTIMPPDAAVVAAGHASGYAMALPWRRIVLLAPTWRGPLPTAMGVRPRLWRFIRGLVRTPGIGQALYALNTSPQMIGMMYRRHVYADASRVTPAFVATRRSVAGAPGARFASAAFVTGGLDPVPAQSAFHALFQPPPAPVLALCGTATPPKSKAEMAAIPAGPDMQVTWVPGSLGLYEEAALAIAEPIVAFLRA